LDRSRNANRSPVRQSAPKTPKNYDQNVGRPGVVYILQNPGLRAGYIKIGCSTRSGYARARDLNRDANTGTPGEYRCVFELRTLDCGSAEKLVFQLLASHRRGKFGQEFFEVECMVAEMAIHSACAKADAAVSAPPPLANPVTRFEVEPNWPPPVTQRSQGTRVRHTPHHREQFHRTLTASVPPAQSFQLTAASIHPPSLTLSSIPHATGDMAKARDFDIARCSEKRQRVLGRLIKGLMHFAYLVFLAVAFVAFTLLIAPKPLIH
jgi:T5orf172 domain